MCAVFTANGPRKLTLAGGEAKWICMCGQSKSGFCNGSHKKYNKFHGEEDSSLLLLYSLVSVV